MEQYARARHFLFITFTILIASCSSSSWKQVQIVYDQPANCAETKKDTCPNSKDCLDWLKKRAYESSSNVVYKSARQGVYYYCEKPSSIETVKPWESVEIYPKRPTNCKFIDLETCHNEDCPTWVKKRAVSFNANVVWLADKGAFYYFCEDSSTITFEDTSTSQLTSDDEEKPEAELDKSEPMKRFLCGALTLEYRVPEEDQAKVIIYEKTYDATFRWQGLDRAWHWGLENGGYNYTISLKPDNKAFYYDFTSEDKVKSSHIFWCTEQKN